MIIRANGKEIAVTNVYSNTMRSNGKDYPALRIVLDGAVTAEEINALMSGKLEMVDDNGNVIGVHDGYTTPGEHSIIIGKITTTEQERDALAAALAVEEQKKPYIESLTESLDDATASTVIPLYPSMKYDGNLIKSGTRINWNGTLKRAAVDLWDTEQNNPDNAKALWEDIQYRDGYRIIPDVITAGLSFSNGEKGWWGDELYESTVDNNVHTPEQYAPNWKIVEQSN
jgi:hypothetical protein